MLSIYSLVKQAVFGFSATVIVCLALLGCTAPADNWSEDTRGVSANEYRVAPGDIRALVPAVGEVLPATKVDVSAEVSGRVMAVHADFDDQVAANQLLAELDPTQFEAAVESAEADVVFARAQHTEAQTLRAAAQREFDRVERLVERGVASDVQLRSASDELTIALARERASECRA